MDHVEARCKEQKDDDTYRMICGARRRKGELCPMYLGTAIRAEDRMIRPEELQEDDAFLGGDFYAGDGLAYRYDPDNCWYVVEAAKAGAQKSGKAGHRQERTQRRPRRPMGASVAEARLSHIGAYEPYHHVRVPNIIGVFPALPISLQCPGCGAINEVGPLPYFLTPEEEDELAYIEARRNEE